MSDTLPTGWRIYAERKGIPASLRPLAAKAGLSHETMRRVINGWNVKPATIRKVADALGIDPEEVHRLRDEPAPDYTREWTPPASSSALTHEEREALNRLVSLMTAGRVEDGEQRVDNTPPIVEVMVVDEIEPLDGLPDIALDPQRTDVAPRRDQS